MNKYFSPRFTPAGQRHQRSTPTPPMNQNRILGLLAAVFCAANVLGKANAEGPLPEGRAGIALVKPQPWSKENEATVLEFLSLRDRRAEGAGGAGYFEFSTRHSPRRQVGAAKVAALLIYPAAADFPEVNDAAERRSLEASLRQMESLAAKFPATKTYLASVVREITGETRRYDTGEVKTNGLWVSGKKYRRNQAAELAEFLKVEMTAAPIEKYDLEGHPQFAALKELAVSDQSLEAFVRDVQNSRQKMIRRTQRKALQEQILSVQTTLPQAEMIVAQWKELHPEEDPSSQAFLVQWDQSGPDRDRVLSAIQKSGSLEKPVPKKLRRHPGQR